MYSWDKKDSPAELSETQRDSVFALATLTEHRPSRHESRQEPESSASDSQKNVQDREETMEIQIASQFYAWLAELEEEMERDADLESRDSMRSLLQQQHRCLDISSELQNSLGQLRSLRDSYTEVSTKTNALHEACEHLLSDQTVLIDKARVLEQSVAIFNSIDAVCVKLEAPNLRLRLENYVQIFNDLDTSYRHLQNHPEYREYSAYMTRLRQALSRTLQALRTSVCSQIDTAVQNVSDQRDPVSAEDAFTFLYGKFRSSGMKVRAMMEVIEERVDTAPEYAAVVTECYRYYLERRSGLLRPVIERAVAELETRHARDHCSFLRAGLALLLHLCEDERRLFGQFFLLSDSSAALTQLTVALEGLCTSLYEAFRPQLIHVNHVETLAEMCSLLREELAQQEEEPSPPLSSPLGTLPPGGSSIASAALPAYASLCRSLLADVRERLVYRAHIYMRSQILHFAPSPGDLAYPDKLRMMLSISAATAAAAGSNDGPESAGGGGGFVNGGDLRITTGSDMPLSPADLHGMWYPTVRRTLVCLSKLSRCLDLTTFQGLSQECLSLCVQSLVSASAQITKTRTRVDGQLFLIKHLLILREQVAPFHLDFSVRETSLDFTKLKDAAYGLLSAKSRLWQLNRSNAILKFVLDSTPNVLESIMDSKKEVDRQLKSTCDLFIHDATQRAIAKLSDFVQKVHAIEAMNSKPDSPKVSLLDQPFAAVPRVQDLCAESVKLVRQGLASLRDSLHVYLYNADLEYILFRPVRHGIAKQFRELSELLAKFYSEEDRAIIACPTEEQLSLTMQG